MAAILDEAPLVVLVGETGSGKSALAMQIALQFDGEIICADSRTVYTGMDIGTAKPSANDQQLVTHHLLDVVTPDQYFTAATFKEQATDAIADIHTRGKLPIMVGGTGLYIDSVLYDYQFSEAGAERDEHNPRHLKKSVDSEPKKLRSDSLVIGLQLERDEMARRTARRSNDMMANGLIDETKTLVEQYGWSAPGLNAIGYKELQAYLAGEQTFEETSLQIAQHTMAYAKRQRTWFKRNKSIQWVSDFEPAKRLVQNFLSKASSPA